MQVGHRRATTVTKLLPSITTLNLAAWQSQRQSLVALSSAEAELFASVWGNRLALSLYGQLMEMILDKPTYITYCDNAAVVQLTQQLSASKTRTRHLSMRASWLHHLVQRENVSMQFVPTTYQKADILTKGLQAYTHYLPERVFDYVFVMVCECATGLSFEEAAQEVNDNISFFGLYRVHFHCMSNVSCP